MAPAESYRKPNDRVSVPSVSSLVVQFQLERQTHQEFIKRDDLLILELEDVNVLELQAGPVIELSIGVDLMLLLFRNVEGQRSDLETREKTRTCRTHEKDYTIRALDDTDRVVDVDLHRCETKEREEGKSAGASRRAHLLHR